MANPVIHFEITGPNQDRLVRFYRDVFNWSIDSDNSMKYGVVKGQEPGIGGGIAGPSPDGGPASSVTVYVSVPDINDHLSRIVSAGGRTLVPKTVVPNMVTFATFTDPAGNVMGIVEDSGRNRPAAKPAAKKAAAKKAPAKKAAKKAPAKKAAKKPAKKAGKKGKKKR